MQISLIIPAHHSQDVLEHTVKSVLNYCAQLNEGPFEVLLVPNPYLTPCRDPRQEATQTLCETLARVDNRIRVVRNCREAGKGAALKAGVLAARGSWILTTDADLPYDLSFFDSAIAHLKSGRDFIYGDRRHRGTRFDVPEGLLAFTAHRLGWSRRFSSFANAWLGLGGVDTQAGIKAFSASFAKPVFEKIQCPGFHFDLELFVAAKVRGVSPIGLPVLFHQSSELSTLRPGAEILRSLRWILKIGQTARAGRYQ